jgi:hypothetical protein
MAMTIVAAHQFEPDCTTNQNHTTTTYTDSDSTDSDSAAVVIFSSTAIALSSPPPPQSPLLSLVERTLLVMLPCLTLVGLAANTLVVMAVVNDRKMRASVMNLLLANLVRTSNPTFFSFSNHIK